MPKPPLKTMKQLEDECDWSDEFNSYRKKKMIMGRLKYGPWKKNRVNVDALGSMMLRLEDYKKTGNKEMLEDIANFAMMEWMLPMNPLAHRRGDVQVAPPLKKF